MPFSGSAGVLTWWLPDYTGVHHDAAFQFQSLRGNTMTYASPLNQRPKVSYVLEKTKNDEKKEQKEKGS